MTSRLLVRADGATDAAPPSPETLIVVLDPTWTPMPGRRTDLVPARRLLGDVVERIDLYDEALALVDGWADRPRSPTAYRRRHDLLVPPARNDVALDPRTSAVAPRPRRARTCGPDRRHRGARSTETALIEVVPARWPGTVTAGRRAVRARAAAPSAVAPPPRSLTARISGDARAVSAPGDLSADAAATDIDGTRTARSDPREPRRDERRRRPRVLVLTNPSTHQRVGAAEATGRTLCSVRSSPASRNTGLQPILLATGVDQRRDEDWALLASDDRMLPQHLTDAVVAARTTTR